MSPSGLNRKSTREYPPSLSARCAVSDSLPTASLPTGNVALLIDADNASHTAIDPVLVDLTNTGWIRSFYFDGHHATLKKAWSALSVNSPTSFGLDARGELYVLQGDGTVLRFARK